MHMGQMIQSHGMHFFELAGPDLLLGFDANPATRNVVGLIQANTGLPEALVAAHMLLAALLASAMTAVVLSLKKPVAVAVPVAETSPAAVA